MLFQHLSWQGNRFPSYTSGCSRPCDLPLPLTCSFGATEKGRACDHSGRRPLQHLDLPGLTPVCRQCREKQFPGSTAHPLWKAQAESTAKCLSYHQYFLNFALIVLRIIVITHALNMQANGICHQASVTCSSIIFCFHWPILYTKHRRVPHARPSLSHLCVSSHLCWGPMFCLEDCSPLIPLLLANISTFKTPSKRFPYHHHPDPWTGLGPPAPYTAPTAGASL